jgi:sulfur carrier protein
MDLTVNGKAHEHTGDGSIDALVLEINAHPDNVAVLVNNDIVPREKRGTVSLNKGDHVEIITMAGGG